PRLGTAYPGSHARSPRMPPSAARRPRGGLERRNAVRGLPVADDQRVRGVGRLPHEAGPAVPSVVRFVPYERMIESGGVCPCGSRIHWSIGDTWRMQTDDLTAPLLIVDGDNLAHR